MHSFPRLGLVLGALSGLTLVQCGGIAFTASPDDGGATGASSGSSSGTGGSGVSSGVGESGTGGSGTATSGTEASGSSSTGDSGSMVGSGSSSGTGQSGAPSGSSSGGSAGSSSGARSGSSSGGSGASSGSVSGPPGPCPTGEPPAGLLCSPDGLECEYGSNPDLSCNSLAECEKSEWTYLNGAGANCPINSCPLTYDKITDGGHCDTAGSSCGYPAGTCSCGSDGPLRVSLDGSVAGPTWHCVPATAACPSPRPRLGATCPTDGQFCDYGACAGGIAIQCTAGTWQEAFTACPG
jgi:hypothetical protein